MTMSSTETKFDLMFIKLNLKLKTYSISLTEINPFYDVLVK